MDSCGSLQGEREFHNELALASKILSAPSSSAAAAAVVLPLGYCSDDGDHPRRQWRWWRPRDVEEPPEVSEAAAASPGRKLLLVYELMRNGSLQDALFDRRCPELMDWERRFAVVLDVARGLHFLHAVCDPPVIHGDIKPSNILLDADLSAKIADFGLARLIPEAHLPAEEEVVIDIDLGKRAAKYSNTIKERKKDLAVGGGDDEGFRVMLPATTSEVASARNGASINSGKEDTALGCRKGFCKKKIGALPGKESGWRQDIYCRVPNSESDDSISDCLMEWIQSEIKKERPKSNWIMASTAAAVEECLPKLSHGERAERKKSHGRLEWCASPDKGLKKEKESRSPREWWREEFCEELLNKQKLKSSDDGCREQQQWQIDENTTSPSEKKKRKEETRYSSSSSSTTDSWTDIPKNGTVSSTPSVRGTVCYIAPENRRGGPISEKCDVYSFGVLLLVITSGRRPLQVTASPMAEFERANLISWVRRLARLGSLLDLLDPCLPSVNREQAVLCIRVALLCLQRSPSRRPTSEELLSMLTGVLEPPQLPLEFSPSPPSR